MSKNRPHDSYWNKHLRKTCCAKCGLVYLNNEATRKAVAKPCPGADKEDGK